MPLPLPLTIVAVDNVAHQLTQRAIEDTLRQIEPEQVLILTDARSRIAIPGADYGPLKGGFIDAMRALWYDAPLMMSEHASHLLWVQWDSWVLDAGCWDPAFLDYDYIGAPWPIEPGNAWWRLGYRSDCNVGNGGFSMRSRRLVHHLREHPDTLPMWLPEDDGICRKLRPALEADGFTWAPEALASGFSFECAAPPRPTFGFHAAANWPRVLSTDAIAERVAMASPWVKTRMGLHA